MKKNNNKAASAELLPQTELTGYAKFKKTLDDNGYLFCSFIIPFAIMWMIFISMRVFPFGPGSVLVLDLNGQYVYFFEALRNAVFGDASLLYSWSRSLGGEFMGIYAYYLASPLSYIVCLFPKENMTEALLLIELIKAGLCGATMSYYLRKTRPEANEMFTIAISCAYALCSYAVVYGHNTMWIDALIWLPLVVLGLEMLIKEHRFVLFCVSLTMTCLSTFYIGYMVCFFVVLYSFYYYFAGSAGKNNLTGEKYHFPKSVGRVILASLISVLASCIIILPTYYSLSFGKTEFSPIKDWAKEFVSRFDLLEFISKLFIGAYDTVDVTGLPFIYCGTIVLLMLPVYFMAKRVTLREKLGALALMLILVLSMNLSIIDIVWHGFQKPNWLNYRYSFLLIFIMLVLAHRALEEIETIRIPYLGASAAGIGLLVLVIQFAKYDHVDTFYCIWLSIILLIIYVAILVPIIKSRLKPVLTTVLAVVICTEAFISGVINTNSLDANVTFSPRDTSSQTWLEGYSNFMSRMRGIVGLVQEADTSFYRMENVDVRKVCDNHALNVRGVSASTSTLNAKTIRFLKKLGYASESHWSEYEGNTLVADSLLGIKYKIFTTEQREDIQSLFKQYDYVQHNFTSGEDENKSLYAYLNPYALSLAYASNPELLDFNTSNYTSPFELVNDLIAAMLGEDASVEVYKKINYTIDYDKSTVNYSSQTYSENVYDKYGNKVLSESGKEEKKNVFYHSFSKIENDAKIYLDFTVPTYGSGDTIEVFAYFPTSYARKCAWSMDEKTGSFYDYTLASTLSVQSLGELTSGDTKRLTLTMDKDGQDLYIDSKAGFFYYLDTALYDEVMKKLSAGNFIIDEFTESSFEGTVNVSEGRTTLFTSIPYDEGWNIFVDGKKVDLDLTCGALISVDLGSEGEHTIKMYYWPKELTAGIALTVLGCAMFATWVVLDIKYFKKKRLALIKENAENADSDN